MSSTHMCYSDMCKIFLDEFFISYLGLKSKMTAAKLSFLTVLNKSDGLGSSRAEPGESGPDIHFLI